MATLLESEGAARNQWGCLSEKGCYKAKNLRPLQKYFETVNFSTDVIPAQAGIHTGISQAIE